MHPTSHFGLILASVLLLGTAGLQESKPAAAAAVPQAQETKPAAPAAVPQVQETKPATPAAIPQVHKMTIYNGSVPTVSYSVEGGSPHLQALSQTLQFTENELNLTGELQKLRLGIVANEQTLDMVRTSQQLGLGPISTPGYATCYPPPVAWPETCI